MNNPVKSRLVEDSNKLLQQKYNNSRYMYDHDNLILRLEDDDTVQEEYFIAEEEIK